MSEPNQPSPYQPPVPPPEPTAAGSSGYYPSAEPPTASTPPAYPGYPQPTYPGYGQPGPAYGQTGQQPTYQQPTYPQPTYQQPAYPQSGYPQSGYPPPAYPPSGYPQPGQPQPGYGQPGFPQPTQPLPTSMGPWVGDPGAVYGYDQNGVPLGPPLPPRRRRHRKAIIIGLVAALLISGTGVAAAYVWYGWGTTEPEDVLPGTVAAFARVDLSPGLGQKLAIEHLAAKFPKPSTASSDDAAEQAKQNLVTRFLSPLNYSTDIEPWLGARIGVAAWTPPGRGSDPCPVLALESKDDAKAKAALSRVDGATAATSNGYAILAECQGATADNVVAAAKTQTLSANSAFSSQLDALPQDQAIVGWVNLAGLASLAGTLGGDFGDEFGGGIDPNATAALPDIDLIVGMKATDDGLELRFRVHSAATTDTSDIGAADAISALGNLPGGTTIGLAADLRSLQGLSDQLNQQGLPTGGDLGGSGLGGDDIEQVTQAVQALLGSVVSLSITDVQVPDLKLIVQAANAQAAQQLAQALSLDNGATISGNTVTVTSDGYNPGSGVLRSNPLYGTAMADAPGNTYLAAFVNVQQLLPALHVPDDERPYLAPVKAVGVALGTSKNTADGLIRVVIQ